jgi:hypothetical protein
MHLLSRELQVGVSAEMVVIWVRNRFRWPTGMTGVVLPVVALAVENISESIATVNSKNIITPS